MQFGTPMGTLGEEPEEVGLIIAVNTQVLGIYLIFFFHVGGTGDEVIFRPG